LSGTGPPKDSHRNSSSPKQDSAKTTITTIRGIGYRLDDAAQVDVVE